MTMSCIIIPWIYYYPHPSTPQHTHTRTPTQHLINSLITHPPMYEFIIYKLVLDIVLCQRGCLIVVILC